MAIGRMLFKNFIFLGLGVLAGLDVRSPLAAAPPSLINIRRLPDGTRFGLIGEKGSRPAPTLFVFQGGLETLNQEPVFTEVPRLLLPHGFISVALDAPAHGEDHRRNEPPELAGWRARIEEGDDFVAAFNTRASKVLDYLIKEGWTDPSRVAVCGTSRGGFLAFHFAATDQRIRLAAGISPVSDLMDLREFKGTRYRAEAEKYSLIELAPRLAHRPVWLSIGNHDLRVNTDRTIAFARALVAAAATPQGANAMIPVDLLVGPTPGHSKIDHASELLAAWILKQFGSE